MPKKTPIPLDRDDVRRVARHLHHIATLLDINTQNPERPDMDAALAILDATGLRRVATWTRAA